MTYVFWYVKVYIFSKFIQYTTHWDKTQMLQKLSFGENKMLQKTYSVFFRELQLITVLLMSWSSRFVSLKACVSFSIIDSVSLLLKLYFCSIKSVESLTLKRHVSFQSRNNRNTTHIFAPKPLIFKLQQEVLKSNDICVSWSSQKTDLETNFLN